MNILESSIRPFEPLGVPRLRPMVTKEVQNIYDSLEAIHKIIRDLELDDATTWAADQIVHAARKAGATDVMCNEQPLLAHERPGYLVYFWLDGNPHLKLLHPKS